MITCKIPCTETFSSTIIKKVLELLRNEIKKKLNEAKSICLISDVWSNKQMLAFMGLVAVVINKHFEKELVVIGMIEMPLRHCAEDIKKAIETIVNSYEFDYSKIKGVCSDEGSAYVRLFKQIIKTTGAMKLSKSLDTLKITDSIVTFNQDSVNFQMDHEEWICCSGFSDSGIVRIFWRILGFKIFLRIENKIPRKVI